MLDNKNIYIYQNPKGINNTKKLFSLILFGIFELIYSISFYCFDGIHSENLYINDSSYSVIDIFYLYLIFKFKHKTIFYRHQNLSLFLIGLMQLIRYYYDILYFNRTTFDFPKDLLFLIPLMIFPLLDSIKNYIIKYFLQYYYYSIYFM